MTTEIALEQERASLTMIHSEPFNAEAPPEALRHDITPTKLHYVRSNFPVPGHDGILKIGGAVANPTTLTSDDLRGLPSLERAVTLECAGKRQTRNAPAPGRGAVGRLCRLNCPLDRNAATRRPRHG